MSEATTFKEREVLTTRVLKAPRKAIFRALTDPEVLQRWWGPKGFTNTFHTFDPKPEGLWEFTMHAPSGQEFHNTCVFRCMDAPSYLEFDHLKEMHFYKATFTLTEEEVGTHLVWMMRFDSADELDPIRPFITAANEENLDKLEIELDRLSSTNHHHL